MKQLAQLIDKYYDDVKPEHWKVCTNATPNSKSCVDCCGKQYFDSNEISYECDQKRKIYVLRYLPVHHKEVYLTLSRISKEVAVAIGGKKCVRVLSIGSGPGSDILAFKKIVADGLLFLDGVTDILLVMIEKESGWDEISDDVLKLYSEGFHYLHKRHHLDFGNRQVKCDSGFDYLLLSYVISELSIKEVDNVARNLQQCIGNPSVLIINDRNEDRVTSKIDRLLKDFKIQNTIIQSGVREWCGVSYPDEIKENVRPKLSTNSVQYTVVVSK